MTYVCDTVFRNKQNQGAAFSLKESDFIWGGGRVVILFWYFWNLCVQQCILDAEKHGVTSLPQWHEPNFWLMGYNKTSSPVELKDITAKRKSVWW